ncbi:hypothetical protein L6452_33269 [Arctium lappa]|uniref:Uncharacterized protein n=1 Tax=Arctium lappa TaxID=4217 RepID=A0ACB8Z605_ARCLA|nr:hypothetical protein L6452_33269 [Arctium lappa]
MADGNNPVDGPLPKILEFVPLNEGFKLMEGLISQMKAAHGDLLDQCLIAEGMSKILSVTIGDLTEEVSKLKKEIQVLAELKEDVSKLKEENKVLGELKEEASKLKEENQILKEKLRDAGK